MDTNDQNLLRLLAELHRLNDAAPDGTAARITIRTAAGEYIGDAILPAGGLQHLTQAASAVADYATLKPGDFTTTPEPVLAPLLVADIDDMFATVDPESFLDDVFGSRDPEASLSAFEQLVTGEWDGGVL